MAVNKVEINGKTIVDLTKDTVLPQTLLSGVTAHNAAGEQIVGVATAGGGITKFPTIEEVRANWFAVDLTDNPSGNVIHIPPSGIILAFIIGRIDDAIDRGIVFLEVKQNQEFDFYSLCNKGSYIHVFELYLDQGAIGYSIIVEDVLGGEVIPNATIQSIIYYTTADNFFST